MCLISLLDLAYGQLGGRSSNIRKENEDEERANSIARSIGSIVAFALMIGGCCLMFRARWADQRERRLIKEAKKKLKKKVKDMEEVAHNS